MQPLVFAFELFELLHFGRQNIKGRYLALKLVDVFALGLQRHLVIIVCVRFHASLLLHLYVPVTLMECHIINRCLVIMVTLIIRTTLGIVIFPGKFATRHSLDVINIIIFQLLQLLMLLDVLFSHLNKLIDVVAFVDIYQAKFLKVNF